MRSQGEQPFYHATDSESMDSKRPDVRLDDSPDEDGIVTHNGDENGDDGDENGILESIRAVFER
ncbi:hypothetical protein [Natrarchaeobius chitinivorans]|uniref:Uncharacterized protein n=1 Tax=Natrarchaeobius chitinivorans TaxID=1679083 RepID=A0A3N6MMB5_NATCH|nr:hypothetical protein [Natrarchaeobius chitinivorans]RQG97201.1 hypothetical protein EA473_03775 [Natrarchaeobius chitinivorans]